MANKRQAKKNKKRLREQKLLNNGYNRKQVNKLNSNQIERAYNTIIQKERKNEQNKRLYQEKKSIIDKYNLTSLSGRKITPKSSWKDINNAVKRQQNTRRKTDKFFKLLSAGYSEEEAKKLVFGKHEITYKELDNLVDIGNVKYNIMPKAFSFGFCDFSENVTIQEIYSYSNYVSRETLLESLKNIVNLKPCYSKRTKSGSNGRAGDYKYFFGERGQAENFHNQRGNEKYSFFYASGEYALYEFTLYDIATIVNAIMNNIIEEHRQPFYTEFYTDICSVIPKARELFPKPR